MNELNILNAGRADSIVCLFDDQETQRCVVIDGGAYDYEGRHVLIDFLHQRGISQIDLLVLTHLHQDHYGGLCWLDEGIKVCHAVVPCGDLVFNQTVLDSHQAEDFWLEYHRAFAYMEKTKTQMMTSREASGRVFRFGECALQCIYPLEDSELISVKTIQEIATPNLTEEEMKRLFLRFKKYCNGDSSIWTLRCGKRQIALLAGDSTVVTMDAALQRYPFHPEVLKLSHHGMNYNLFNPGLKYFSAEQIAALDPQIVVVPNSSDMAEKTCAECEELGAARIHYTWDSDFCYTF